MDVNYLNRRSVIVRDPEMEHLFWLLHSLEKEELMVDPQVLLLKCHAV